MNDTQTQATSYSVTAGELRAFVERLEKMDAEKRDLAEQRKEVLAEAKGCGYDGPAIAAVIKLRAADPDKLSEFEAVLELYKETLGME